MKVGISCLSEQISICTISTIFRPVSSILMFSSPGRPSPLTKAVVHCHLLGGGPAALSCAETLRQEGFTGRIVMVIKEKRVPYDRVKLSKNLAIEPDSITLRSRTFFEVRYIWMW